ncbi:hypothetical protein JCM8208_003971 [Rhodotorula glutinis]
MDDVQARLLKELDHYLAFFKRRQEIEQDYVDSLKKLSLKTAQGDTQLGDELHAQLPTSWRKAWVAVRLSVEDEVLAHRGAADGLDRVVHKLTSFRDDRERTRRRIREDLRSTATEWADYKTVVHRLRKTYERKVEELQHHEEAEAMRDQEHSPAPGSRTEAGWPPEHWSQDTIVGGRHRSDSATSSKGGPGASDAESPPPTVTSPGLSSPFFVSGATSSASIPSAYRDAPTGKQNVFEAITKRDWAGEKHRVNSIVRAVGSLAKGNDPVGALGPSRQRSRQYTSKLKREAELADRDYRSGIFQLETLRLQKMRVQTSARESLREFVLDLASNLKSAFAARVDEQMVLGHVQGAIAEHVKPEVDKIDAQQDASTYFITVQDQSPPDPPVYYVNAFVGECKSLLFGVGLQDYHAKHPDLLVPLIVQRCVANIESTGLDSEGIYRVPGKLAKIQQLVHRMEKEEEAFEFGSGDEVAAVAGVLKLYLRQLPTPVFPFSAPDRRAWTAEFSSSAESAIGSLIRRIRRLSPPQQATLKVLCQHLANISEYEHVNKMSPSNLALIFSTVIFGEDEAATLESAMNGSKDNVMEILIRHHAPLFRDLPIDPVQAPRSRQGSDPSETAAMSPGDGLSAPPLPRRPLGGTGTTTTTRAHSPQRLSMHEDDSSRPAGRPRSSSMRNAGSADSVYALYERATTPGSLPADPLASTSPPPHIFPLRSSAEPAPASRPSSSSSIPDHATHKEHASRSTTPHGRPLSAVGGHPSPSAVSAQPAHERSHSFGEPDPPAAAAHGRYVQ